MRGSRPLACQAWLGSVGALLRGHKAMAAKLYHQSGHWSQARAIGMPKPLLELRVRLAASASRVAARGSQADAIADQVVLHIMFSRHLYAGGGRKVREQ